MKQLKMKQLRKIGAFSLCLLLIVMMLTACGKKEAGAASTTPADTGSSQTFTLDELKKYDGKNGNKAYVAVDGVVYDVTGNPKWENGEHNGFSAGNDLTDAIAGSPHGKGVLGKLTVVGKLK